MDSESSHMHLVLCMCFSYCACVHVCLVHVFLVLGICIPYIIHVPSLEKVTERDMADILNTWVKITPSGVITTLKTW